jgi:fatty-acid desaturase
MVARLPPLMTLGVEFRPQRFEKTLANVVVNGYLFLMRRHWGIFVRTVFNPHTTWPVNSATHMGIAEIFYH